VPCLERVDMRRGSVLYESGDPRRYVYFPTTSIVCLMEILQTGGSAEFAVTGNEGVVGLAVFMSGQSAPVRAVVYSAGCAYQIKASVFKKAYDRSVALQQLLWRYAQALMTQVAQTAVCNRYHTVMQQFCRLLLLSLDRLSGNELAMTQEGIAGMLGVRRVGVTEVAGKLQEERLINYRRGRITVLHRRGLEERVCECYGIVKKEYDRLLDQPGHRAI
jgi:CRP-like cAMP-binding protein